MLDAAIESLKKGKVILLHDSSGREDEIDMVSHASHTTADIIQRMRSQAGGLVCLALGKEVANALGLPFMADLLEESGHSDLVPQKTAYGDRPAFSLSVNHRDTFTGITDMDRAKTITELQKTSSREEFAKSFYAPGHVHLLISRGIEKRRGHTELSVELARRSGLSEHMVLCEMMADNHKALSLEDAKTYAKDNNLILVNGGSL